MNKKLFVRLAGWSLILGTIVFLPGLFAMMLYDTKYEINWDSPVLQVYMWIMFLSPILLAIGLMGLRARYRTGGGFLLFGAVVGGSLAFVGTFGQMFAPVYSVSEVFYEVWFASLPILFVGLTLFGLNAWVEKPLPRWNELPLLSGLWFILVLPLFWGLRRVSVEAFLITFMAGYLIMAVALIMLGYSLQADASQEMATA